LAVYRSSGGERFVLLNLGGFFARQRQGVNGAITIPSVLFSGCCSVFAAAPHWSFDSSRCDIS